MTERRAVVAHNVTPMRAQPDDRSEQVSQAIFGENVVTLREEGIWTEVRTPDGYTGFARTAHLVPLEKGTTYPNPALGAMVAPLFLPVFRAPSSRSERRTLLTLGSVLEMAQGDPDAPFYPVRMPTGELGYVESSALIVPQFPPLENLGPNLAVVARGLIGVPYLWGGRTPFGLDCSGFTQRVYALCGHVLPRDAYQQAAWDRFEAVERADLRVGDLLFFGGEDDPRGREITHVGMALADGRFIHAQGGTGVTTTPFDAPPYDRMLRGISRLVI